MRRDQGRTVIVVAGRQSVSWGYLERGVGELSVRSIDRVQPRTRRSQIRPYDLPTKWANYTRYAALSWTLVLAGIRELPCDPCTASPLCRFDHDRQIKATSEAQRCHPLTGCRHRPGEHREGSLEHDTSSSCFWRRHYPSHYDQGEFHPLREQETFQAQSWPGQAG